MEEIKTRVRSGLRFAGDPPDPQISDFVKLYTANRIESIADFAEYAAISANVDPKPQERTPK